METSPRPACSPRRHRREAGHPLEPAWSARQWLRTRVFRTSRSAAPADGASRAQVFDPALKQFVNAIRPGDPTFDNADAARRW